MCRFTYLEQELYAGLLHIDLHNVLDTLSVKYLSKKAEPIISSDNVVSWFRSYLNKSNYASLNSNAKVYMMILSPWYFVIISILFVYIEFGMVVAQFHLKGIHKLDDFVYGLSMGGDWGIESLGANDPFFSQSAPFHKSLI